MTESDNKAAKEAEAQAPAALVRAEGAKEPATAEPPRDTRLDRLPLQLDVMLPVRFLRVRELLALGPGSVVETAHAHAQDVPVWCGEKLLAWGEFEVAEQRLAVRVTRLA